MIRRKTIPYFGGLFTALGGKAPELSAGDLLNVLTGQTLRPRRGFKRVTPRFDGEVTVQGLEALNGAGEGSGTVRELLLVRTETEAARTYPLALSLSTPLGESPEFAEITNVDDPVPMDPQPVSAFVFRNNAYVIQPGGSLTTVWRHEIGNAKSFEPLQNTTYEPPPPDPTFEVKPLGISELAYTADPETVAFSMDGASDESEIVTADKIELRGRVSDDGGTQVSRVAVTYQTPYEIPAGARYVSIALEVGVGMEDPKESGAKLELDFGDGLVPIVDFKVTGANEDRWALSGIIPEDVSLPASLVGFKLTVKSDVVRDPALKPICTLYRLQVGGTPLTATSSAQRPWNADVPEASIVYGARLRNTDTEAVTEIKQAELNFAALSGPDARHTSFPLGNRTRITLETVPTTDPLEVQFLRKKDEDEWYVLGSAPVDPDGGAVIFTDVRRQDEADALESVSGEATPLPAPPPTFVTTGLKAGVAYKDWAVWFFKGGTRNVRHSRKGKPEDLREAPESEYEDDTTAPGDYSLEGRADEPIGGIQAGQILVVFGERFVYTQYGDAPSAMTDLRKIPEAGTAAGPRAFCRYRENRGDYSTAWMDPHGNVYQLIAAPRFSGDASAEPTLLSLPIPRFAREFLGLDLSGVIAQYDERRDSLWFVLGRRALVLRPGDPVEGARRWEAYEYNVLEDGYDDEEWTPWSAVSDPTQLGLGASWSTFEESGKAGDEVSPDIDAGSKTLRRVGYLSGLIPEDRSVFEVQARITETSEGPLTRTAHVEGFGVGLNEVATNPNGVSDLPFLSSPEADADVVQAGELASVVQISATSGPVVTSVVLNLQSPGWLSTGVTLPPNVEVSVVATGEGTWNGWADAQPWGSYFPYPGDGSLAAPYREPFSLVMAIAATQPEPGHENAIQGSNSFSFNSGSGGPLWMAFNDDNSGGTAYGDNTGSFQITITYQNGGSCTTTSFTLPVNSPFWYDSGVVVPEGYHATVSISGSWMQAGARVFPEGAYYPDDPYGANDPTHPYQPGLLQPGEGTSFPEGFACSNTRIFSATMAARPGSWPPPFGISDGLQPDRGPTRFESDQVGGKRLWFLVNDQYDIYFDNLGSLSVTIVVCPDLPPYTGKVEMRARYGSGVASVGGTFAALAFDRGDSWAMRSDSALCILESDPDGEEIDAPLRDAGRPMPEGRWLSGWEDGDLRRVADATSVRTPAYSLVARAETPSSPYTHTVASGRSYGRFPVSAQGVRWRFGASVLDDSGVLDSLTFDLVTLAPKRADRNHI